MFVTFEIRVVSIRRIMSMFRQWNIARRDLFDLKIYQLVQNKLVYSIFFLII